MPKTKIEICQFLGKKKLCTIDYGQICQTNIPNLPRIPNNCFTLSKFV